VIILPVFGIFSELFSTHSRKPLFGYAFVALASFAIVFLGLIVWVHHFFPSGVPVWMRNLFMVTTMLISVPTGVKVFAWLATIWAGKLRLNTPMLFCLGGLFNFVFAGVTGIMLATVPIDIHVNNTYFVVGHFHYVIYGAAVMGIFAAIYHWFSKFTGRMYYEGLGKLHFALTFIGSNLNFFPMHPLGLMGMPRRVSSYDPEFAFWNVIASLGSFLLGVSIIPFLLNMISSWIRGPQAPQNPWQAIGLEWLLPSPPPAENFEENVPTVVSAPYGYGTGRPLVENQSAYENQLPSEA
jgi:cytochrome c oxidase subunit 1